MILDAFNTMVCIQVLMQRDLEYRRTTLAGCGLGFAQEIEGKRLHTVLQWSNMPKKIPRFCTTALHTWQ